MLTMTDMFCGAGGSSTGALEVPGVEVKAATNHWDLAIETHNTNHQDADHILADVSQIDPRYFPHSDILWASPECTNHSQAKGVKRVRQSESLFERPDDAAERSRATMWDVPRFAEHHQYKIIITENVVDAAKWVMWDAWLMAMDALGYDHHVVYMNSMHAQAYGLPAPQSRDRMYVVFWRKGNRRPDFDRLRPQAYCTECDESVRALQVFKKTPRWGRYRTQYQWRCPSADCRNAVVEPGWLPASSVIDWSLPADRIGDRPLKEYWADKKKTVSLGRHPLAPKTMARIEAGLKKYVEPMLMRNNNDRAGSSMCTPTTEAMRTLTTAGHQSLLVPVEGREGKDAVLTGLPMRTQTTRNETGLTIPPMIVNNVSGADSSRTTTVHDPSPTFVAGGLHASLVVPPELHLEAAGNTYDSTDPRRGGDYYRIWPETEPFRTMHTSESKGVVIPLRNNNTPKSVADPFDTFAAAGTHHGLAQAESIDIMDCLFRMLSPQEIKLGMAFPGEYTLLGTKREQVRMAGNAVCPPNARDLIRVAVASLIEEAA